MARTADLRRHYEERSKARARRRAMMWSFPNERDHIDARFVGLLAHTPHPCSGYCCGNPRKWFGQKTRQEVRDMEPLDGF